MTLRDFQVDDLRDAVEGMCEPGACEMPADVLAAMEAALEKEDGDNARSVLRELLDNYRIAREERIPICQDTGMVVVFLDVGLDVRLIG
ncbi:MAG: fumarate hydratase, partial [Saccharofermentanales bacterium]